MNHHDDRVVHFDDMGVPSAKSPHRNLHWRSSSQPHTGPLLPCSYPTGGTIVQELMQDLLPTIDSTHLVTLTASATALRAVVRLVDSVHETVHNMRKRKR